MARKNVFSQFASLGEEALGKIAQNPSASKVVQGAMEKVDDLGRRVRGLEGMEKRIAELEARIKKLEGAQKRTTTGAKKPAEPKP
jgi:hypothetical protein